jgi:uncharacterized protein YecT (DUF1311 family)
VACSLAREHDMKTLLALVLLMATADHAAAHDAPDCANQMDQSTMTRCAGIDFEKADEELNRIWPSLKEDAQDADAEASEGNGGFLDALMASQRAWLAYRDAECVLQGFEARGGSMEPMLVNACLAAMTTARIKELQREGVKQ